MSRVRRTINEAQVNEAEFYEGADESEIDSLIKSRILEALHFVHGFADASLLDPDKTVTALTGVGTIGTSASYTYGYIDLPNYLRVKNIRVQGWHKALTEVLEDDDVEYAKQTDPYACGIPERPMAFLSDSPATSGAKRLELYTLPAKDSTVRVEYMEWPKTPDKEDGGVDVSDKLVEAYVYHLSGLVLVVLNDSHAEDLLSMASALMCVSVQKKGGE